MTTLILKKGISCEYGHDVQYQIEVIKTSGNLSQKTVESINDNSPSLIHTNYEIIELTLSDDFKGKVIQHVNTGVNFSNPSPEIVFENDLFDFAEYLSSNEIEVKVPYDFNGKVFRTTVKGYFDSVDEIIDEATSQLDYRDKLTIYSRSSVISQLEELARLKNEN